MAKKVERMKPMPKMGSGKGGGHKKADRPAHAAGSKKHERVAKPSEEERIAKGRQLAASYLEQRDGLDPDTAKLVVDSMVADDVNALITEANTTVLERTPAAPMPANGAPAHDTKPYLDFFVVPGLADTPISEEEAWSGQTLAEVVLNCSNYAKEKNTAEKFYKESKKIIIAAMDKKMAGMEREDRRVECAGVKLARYQGHSTSLSPEKLLEKGVSIDVINACYVTTDYEDVRVTGPKE